MKNSIGKHVQISVFGESHGEAIGVVIDGLAAGIKLDLDYINHKLDLRRPKGRTGTARREADELHFISGYFNGYTTGSPLSLIFSNSDTHSNDYEQLKHIMRPSHADYSANQKYDGYNDYRGGGHFSGRLTAAIVAAGAIAAGILASKGIKIASHITKMGSLIDQDFNQEDLTVLETQIHLLNQSDFPVIDQQIKEKMQTHIEEAAKAGDSVGGIVETIILGLDAGYGEPMFDSLESTLAHYLFSVPALKGVEFGLGFDFANYYGSEVNDALYYDKGIVKTKTNNNGGINGGISNGMPIIYRSVIKPTPSIYQEQDSIDLTTQQNVKMIINGRHDPAIVHRARVVIDCVSALALLDSILEVKGSEWMKGDASWNMD